MNSKPFVLARGAGRIGSGKAATGSRKGALGFLFALTLLFYHSVVLAESVSLDGLEFASLPGGSVQITLKTSGPVAAPNSFVTDNPARIALDFADARSGLAKKSTKVGIGAVESVTAVGAGNRVRVVINLVRSVPYRTKIVGNDVIVTVEGSEAAVAAAASSEMASEPAAPKPTTKMRYSAGIQDIDFRRGAEGQGRVMVTLADPATIIDVREEGTKVLLDFKNTTLPPALMERLDVTDFATPVTTVETRPSGKDVRMEIKAAGEYEYMAYQANDLFTVEFRPLTKAEKEALKKQKEVYTGDRLSLNFQDIEVRAVLQLLADFTGFNLVTSDTVTGRVTLRLKNVPWDQALDIILKTRGLAKRVDGNVMLVAPIEEIAAREKLELESEQQIEELAPLRSEYIQINYAKAETLATLLKSPENPFLTPERGNVSFDARTNTLLVQDTAAKLEDIRRLISVLDIPIRQVLIESRVVIANDDFAKDLGVRFGFNRGNTWSDQDKFAIVAGGLPGSTAGTFGLAPGIENPAGSGSEALMVNLPVTAPSGAVNLLLGKIGSYLLQLELSAMQTEGKGEVISSPKVITSDQNKATIKQGFEIPYQSSSANLGTTVEFKEAVLKLDVTPHITPDDRVLMDLVINKDSPDFSRSVLGEPPIDTRSVTTTVLVDNGETVVLGGIFERNTTDNLEKVPFFGDLPFVGFLFKKTEFLDTNSELLIFVTPRILKESLGVR